MAWRNERASECATYDDDANNKLDDDINLDVDGTDELGDDVDSDLDVSDNLDDDRGAVAALGVVAGVCASRDQSLACASE